MIKQFQNQIAKYEAILEKQIDMDAPEADIAWTKATIDDYRMRIMQICRGEYNPEYL